MSIQVQVVKADSLADYLTRYYKQDRLRSVDDAYGEGTLLASYQEQLDADGYVCTSHHDNVTGTFIYWPYRPENAGSVRQIETK